MNKRTLTLLACMALFANCFSQNDFHAITEYEQNLYSLIFKNFAMNHILKEAVSIQEKCFKQSHNIATRNMCFNESVIMDTNSYIPISFNPANIDIQVKNIFFVEYNIDLNSFIYKNCGDVDNIMVSYGLSSYNNLMTKGLVAIDTVQHSFYFISGYLFYLDNINDIYEVKFTENGLKEYVLLKYYNYSPYNITISKKWITFNTRKVYYENGFSKINIEVIRIRHFNKKGVIEEIE